MRCILCVLLLCACQNLPSDLPTTTVVRGEFLVSHFEGGEIQASSGEVVMSPRIGGSLKIVHLWPEGTKVEIGDLILQFDPAEFEREMLDREGRLEQALSDFAKSQAERKLRLATIKRKIEQQIAQRQLAELNQERQKFASVVDQEQSNINLERAIRSLEEARQESIAQEVINRVDQRKHELNINRKQERYNRALRNYERTSIKAAKPGIVVYRKIWKRGFDKESKIAIGDQVWGGRALLDIPDMSMMQVRCLIGEMDIGRMREGQRAFIRLEAFPGPVFTGIVSELAAMASPQPGAPDIRVFELMIDIDEQDDRLKPGMSAEVEIILERIPNVLSVPLSAIVDRNGNPTVYRFEGGQFNEVPVELGQENATSVIVSSGLSTGDLVALPPPQAP